MYNSNSKKIQLQQINTASISLIHENVNKNDEELEKIKKLVQENKEKGYKIPLLANVFLLFYNSGKNTLKKSEAYALMEKEAINNKNIIISSPTERYCMINQKNYKSKIKDILKKKKWFSRKVNDTGEIEYTLNPGVVASVVPKITSYLKVLVKNNFLFKCPEEEKEEKEDENNNNEGKKDKKERKKLIIKKKHTSIGENKINKKKRKKLIKKSDIINEKNKKKEDFDIIIEEEEKSEKISSNESDCLIIQPIEDKIDGLKIKIKTDNNESDNYNNIKDNNNDDCAFLSENQYLNKKRKSQINKYPKRNKIKIMKNMKHNLSYSASPLEHKDKINIIEEKTIPDTNELKPSIEKDLKNDENEPEIENASLENKIDSVINIGETFLKLLKNKKFSQLTSKKLDSIRNIIEEKEKEIKSYIQFMEKIIQREEKVKSSNTREIERKIKDIKINYKEYKEKIELLSNNKKRYENSANKEDEKEIINIYNENFDKCSKISEKIISDFSLIFNDYISIGELMNILWADEKGENYFDMKSITNIEDYGNMFKKELNNIMIDVKVKNNYNFNYNDIINTSNIDNINHINNMDRFENMNSFDNINNINNNNSMNYEFDKEDNKLEFDVSNAGSALAAGAINTINNNSNLCVNDSIGDNNLCDHNEI